MLEAAADGVGAVRLAADGVGAVRLADPPHQRDRVQVVRAVVVALAAVRRGAAQHAPGGGTPPLLRLARLKQVLHLPIRVPVAATLGGAFAAASLSVHSHRY